MQLSLALLLSLLATAAAQDVDSGALSRAVACNKEYGSLKFLLLENEAVNAAVEDDIRKDLAEIGLYVIHHLDSC